MQSRSEVRERQVQQQGAGAVAQDILLVPRTVYVPYAAQVPVAPARLAGLAAPGPAQTVCERHEVTEQRGTFSEARQAAVSASRDSDAALNLQLLQALRALNDKLERQQMRAAPAPVQAPVCPSAPPCAPMQPPCPPPAAPPPGPPCGPGLPPVYDITPPGVPLPQLPGPH
jgi:hypothetical protein